MSKPITRITVDLPTVDHRKLKTLADFHEKSMREILIELIEHGLEHYQECPENHTPNKTTKKALENVKARKNLEQVDSVEELFKKLDQ